MIAGFQAAWRDAWDALGLRRPEAAVLRRLLAAWAEPHRRYHTPQHLRECLALFDRHRALAVHPGEVAVALWFHDAVYDTARHDNEAESADWAVRVLRAAGAAQDVAVRVRALIMATCHRGVPETADGRLLVDIDLAILGTGAERFAEYERQIRDEYGFVPEALFRQKRGEILRGFLARPALFSTPVFAGTFEAAARVNLAVAIDGLG